MNGFEIYILDTETTGLDAFRNDVIELSIYRLSNDSQKTWRIKAENPDTITKEALRVNGHKLEDITHKTKFGIETYLPQNKVIVDVENWMMEDGVSPEDRIVAGQNCAFDLQFLRELWRRCSSEDTIPFGRKTVDTLQIAILFDLISNRKRDSYKLTSLCKDFSVKLEKAHKADADVRMTKDLLLKQLEHLKKNSSNL